MFCVLNNFIVIISNLFFNPPGNFLKEGEKE